MNQLINQLNAIGADLLSWGLWMNMWLLFLLLAVVVADRLASRSISPGIRIMIYGVLVLRLMTPLSWTSPVGLLGLASDTNAVNSAWWLTDPLAGLVSNDAILATEATGIADTSQAQQQASASLSWFGIAALSYGAISLALLTGWCWVRLRLNRKLRQARSDTDTLDVGGCRYQVLIHPSLGPAVIRVFRPAIVIPQSLIEPSHNPGLSWILRHEQAHLSRRDPQLLAAMQLLTVLLWPIVPLWIAVVRVRQLMEQASDARALSIDTSPAARRSYGETLMHIAQQASTPRTRVALSNLGLLGHASIGLRRRLRALSTAPAAYWPRTIQLSLTFIATLVLISCAMHRDQSALSTSNDSPIARAGQIDLTFTLIDSWVEHPSLDFNIPSQSTSISGETDAAPADDGVDYSTHRNLSGEQFRELLQMVADSDAVDILTSPRLLVFSGVPSSITIGEPDQDEYYRFDVTARNDDIGGGHDRPTIDLTVEARTDITRPLYRHVRKNIAIPVDGARVFLVSDGPGVGDTIHRLLAVQAHVVGGVNSDVDSGVEEPGAAVGMLGTPPDEPSKGPYVEFYSVVWELPEKPELSDVIPLEYQTQKTVWMGDERTAQPFDSFYLLPKENVRDVIEWLRANGRGTSGGGKAGARYFPTGGSTSIRVSQPNPDDLAERGYTIRAQGDIVEEVDGATLNLSFALDREKQEDGKQLDADPLVVLQSTFTLGADHWAILTVPGGSQAPWRVMLVRTGIAETLGDLPHQTGINSKQPPRFNAPLPGTPPQPGMQRVGTNGPDPDPTARFNNLPPVRRPDRDDNDA